MTKTVETNCLKLANQATAVDMQDHSYYRYTFLLLVLIQLAHVNTFAALKNRMSALGEQTQVHQLPSTELFVSEPDICEAQLLNRLLVFSSAVIF